MRPLTAPFPLSQVGQWYPLQLLAYFHGAHGSPTSSIYGSDGQSPTSIVLSAESDMIWGDEGDFIEYSVLRSRAGSNALANCHINDRPVRVLRSTRLVRSNPRFEFFPKVGIRYDGLYRVIAAPVVMTVCPDAGSVKEFLKYGLERLDDQPPLEDIVRSRPGAEEKKLFTQYKDILYMYEHKEY